jgi:hypothetical protein
MLSPTGNERRRAPRHPCERLARIQGNPPRPCLITDFSDGGVRIKTIGFDVPDEFVLLRSSDGPNLDGTYKVVWRLGLTVGAKFVSSEAPWRKADIQRPALTEPNL